MAKNVIEITPDMSITLAKVRKKKGEKLSNQQALEEALKILDKKL